jgi:hypothetical protein
VAKTDFSGAVIVAHDILDDDPSIHEAWEERFLGILNTKIEHLYDASELSLKKIGELSPDLYLIDYELLSDNINGLDIIESLKLETQSFLVTSCFEDVSVRNRCENLMVKIIPKLYVPYIKINLPPQFPPGAKFVFIDNDEMMRTTWAFAASEAEKQYSGSRNSDH